MKSMSIRCFWKKIVPVCFAVALPLLLLSSKDSTQHIAYGQPSNVPATFYGTVQTSASIPAFLPAVGMTVEAVINGQVCGQAEMQQQNSEIVYVIKVLADNEVAGITGCGAAGATVTFFVVQTQMQPTGTWDNSQVWELDLSPDGSSGVPDAPVQLAPLGNLSIENPTFEWQSVSNATGYEIVVYNVTTDTIDYANIYPASSACSGSPCSITPANLTLLAGDYTWLIRSLNGALVGPWSVYML